MERMTKLKTLTSVADILERELGPTIKEWLRRVNLVPELTNTPLSDEDRTGHLPKLYYDLICRLRLASDVHSPFSAAASSGASFPSSIAGSVFGHVVGVYINDAFIKNGRLDTAAMKPIARCGYDEYAVVENVFKMTRPKGGG